MFNCWFVILCLFVSLVGCLTGVAGCVGFVGVFVCCVVLSGECFECGWVC